MLTIYRASAGSGKTYTLTRDYIGLLFKAGVGNAHRRILAVTFTNKATDEMKSRILQELNILATGKASGYREGLMKELSLKEEEVNQQAKAILISILHDYSAFNISTIDKFFQQVIRSFARELGVYGGYAVELDTEMILEQAVDNMFLSLGDEENKQLLQWLSTYSIEEIENAKTWNIRTKILSLGWEIFKEKYQQKSSEITNTLHDKEFLKKYRNELRQIIKTFTENTSRIARSALNIIERHGLALEDFSYGKNSSIKNLSKVINGDYALSDRFRKMADEVNACYSKTQNIDIIQNIESAYYGGLQDEMQELIGFIDEHFAQYNTALHINAQLNSLAILSDIDAQIRKLTADQNSMLISDTNIFLHQIIDQNDAPFIYEKTGMFLKHFMIDEFQDTSDLQWQNFFPLMQNSISESHENLVVGDVKQSIYRWRNSDWKLLDSGIQEDFPQEQWMLKNLDTNWRSDKNIVSFNNDFFTEAASMLQNILNEKIDSVILAMPELEYLKQKISNAYREEFTKQKTKANADEGYVKIHFIEKSDKGEDDIKWYDKSLNLLPGILETIQDKGFKPAQVTILVRTNNDAKKIVEKLLQHKVSAEAKAGYSYDIMGSEGIALQSAGSIKFLLATLKLLVNPEDTLQKMMMEFEYAKGKLRLCASEAIRKIIMDNASEQDGPETSEQISRILSTAENTALARYKHFSLFEMIEHMIVLFDLKTWNQDEVIFLQAFQDIVYKFSTSKSSDLNAFLQWWDKFGDKQSVITPENENAFRIMTIHKSKGLDFDIVVMPFCDWELDTKSENIQWVETDVEPFNQLPQIPVAYSSKLGQTVFAHSYYEEMMHAFMDNLNLAYVAFTRPKYGLIALTQWEANKNRMANIIQTVLNTDDNLKSYFNAETKTFEIGKLPIQEQHIQSTTADSPSNDYPISLISNRLKLKHKVGMFNREEIDITESPLDYGNLMHEIFYRMQSSAESELIVQEQIRDGRINEKEAKQIQADLNHFWQIPETNNWFKPGAKVLTETTILTPEGYQYRPDRIILEENTATIIDYKFGEKELPSHIKQVQNYSRLLREMGYQTQAYLCYVKLKKVQAVRTDENIGQSDF